MLTLQKYENDQEPKTLQPPILLVLAAELVYFVLDALQDAATRESHHCHIES